MLDISALKQRLHELEAKQEAMSSSVNTWGSLSNQNFSQIQQDLLDIKKVLGKDVSGHLGTLAKRTVSLKKELDRQKRAAKIGFQVAGALFVALATCVVILFVV